jgi:hypothetical protein
MPRSVRPGRLALAAAIVFSLWPAAGEASGRTLREATYDFAVTSYCGTLTPEVEAGYKREIASLTQSLGLDADEAKAQRIAGWVAADLEWSNRGLGGYRAWCQGEAVKAADWFLRIQRNGGS